MTRVRGSLRALVSLFLLVTATTQSAPAAPVIPAPVPRAVCGPGAIPESGVQGRVTAADLQAGTGFRCNLEMIGHTGTLAGFRTHRYIDQAGHECAFYDSSPYFQTRPNSSFSDPEVTGTHVLDMSHPASPTKTAELDTPAMRSPHESLSINYKRGLLASDLGNLVTGPGFVDIYSIKEDCLHPALMASLPTGLIGHEGTFSPDGNTFWVSAGAGAYINDLAGRSRLSDVGSLVALDVSNPRVPRPVWASGTYAIHGLNISADGNTLYGADLGMTRGLVVLDISKIQSRAPVPTVTRISHLTWDTVSLPQTPIPVTIGGHPYLVEVDEFTHDTIGNFFHNKKMTRPEDMVGAARIIDIANPRAPFVVSDIRLEVNQPGARAGAQSSDPGANTATGYAAHYCAVPRATDPKIVACSFILSGLRVFDIRDPFHPKEIAYFNPPSDTKTAYNAMSAAAFVPERSEIWYTDANYGFYVLKANLPAIWP
jgi:hypothetical protein